MYKLEALNLSKKFGLFIALDNINFTVEENEFVVLVGPSGCGKSTLLRIIAGLDEISDGELLINGQLMNNICASKRGLAMVFQSYALYPHMTVYENLSVGLKIAKVKKNEINEKVLAVAKTLQIEDLLSKYPKHLSGGQRQRVAIGRAIIREPEIFLFDEPLSNLDASLRIQMRLELARLHQKLKATMIYVTHDHVEAMTLADKIIVLNQGKIEQIGKPLQLYNFPKNKFIALFLGSPKMNIFKASIKHQNKQDGILNIQVKGFNDVNVYSKLDDLSINQLELGIRPEDLIVNDDVDSQDALFYGYINYVEQLGSQSVIYIDNEYHKNISVLTNKQSNLKVGQKVSIFFRQNKIHLFDFNGESKLIESTSEAE